MLWPAEILVPPPIAPLPRGAPAYAVVRPSETANAIAQIKGIPVEEMSEILYQNSLAAFHLTEA